MNEEKIFQEELEHLDKTIEAIDNGYEYYDNMFDQHKHTIIGFKEGQRGTQFTRQAMMTFSATKADRLRRVRDNPYFGKFSFKKKFSNENDIYVGKATVHDKDDNVLVYDWRTPICSLYYENGLGDVSYESPNGLIEGEVTLRRQIKIENSKLLEAYDTSGLSQDEFLIPFLSVSANSRLKNIVASIQTEQNKIIRKKMDNNLIVQGTAGSGKTTVALHRIAYLIYLNSGKLTDNQFLIIGPNKYFMNYISEVLPDLDVETITQNTFQEIIEQILKNKIKIEDQTISLEKLLSQDLDAKNAKFKSSMEFNMLLDNYLNSYFLNLFTEDMVYNNITLLKVDRVKSFIDTKNFSAIYEKLDRLQKYTIKSIKENKTDIKNAIWNQYRDEFKSLDKSSPRRKEILNLVDELEAEVDKGCPNIVKEYFKPKLVKPINIYIDFLEYLKDSNIKVNDIDFDGLYNESKEYLNKGKVRYEDLGSLLNIAMKLYNTSSFKEIKHVVIDEAQDFGIFHFNMLKKLFSNATFSIFGDLNQSIYSYRGVDDWNSVKEYVFNDNCEILELNKSYRTTKEIVDLSNSVLDVIDCKNAIPVLRHGKITTFTQCPNKSEDFIIDKIKEYKEKGYKSIAIITKDEKTANNQYKNLVKKGLDIKKISYNDTKYNGGICIMPSYLSKGLEFDAVIISDGDELVYDKNSITDLKLLYVSSTRPLHELNVIYKNKLTLPFDNYLNKVTKNQKVLKLTNNQGR